MKSKKQCQCTQFEYPKLDLAPTFTGKVPNGVFSKNWFPFATHGSSVTKRDLKM